MSDIPKLFLPLFGDRDAPAASRFDATELSNGERAGAAPNSTNANRTDDADRREGPRVCLQLGLALIYPRRGGPADRPMFHGRTHDIGMSGLSIIVDYNVLQEGQVTVVLALPLAHAGAARKVVTSTAEMTYAIHSSKLDAYKIGLRFREFRGNGKRLLEAVLLQALKEEGAGRMQTTSNRLRAHRPKDSQPLGW